MEEIPRLNESGSPNYVSVNSPIKLVGLIVMSVVAAFGVVGNTLILIVIGKFRSRRIVPNYLIASMAVGDWVVCAAVIPVNVCIDLAKDVPSHIYCRFVIGIVLFFTILTYWNLCPIVLDRYLAIRFPVLYRRRRNTRMAIAAIAVSWAIPALLASPFIFASGEKLDGRNCTFHKVGLKYFLFCLCVGWALPFLFLLCVNIAIAYQVLKRRKKHRRPVPFPQPRRALPLVARPTRHHLSEAVRAPLMIAGADSQPGTHSVGRNTVSFRFDSGLARPSFPRSSTTPVEDVELTQLSGPSGVINGQPVETRSERSDQMKQSDQTSGRQYHDSRCDVAPATSPTPKLRQPPALGNRVLPCDNFPRPPRGNRVAGQPFLSSREKRAVIVTGIVMVAAVVFPLPTFVYESCQAVLDRDQRERAGGGTVGQALWWLGWCNSAISPMIYTVFRRDFRFTLRKLFSCARRH